MTYVPFAPEVGAIYTLTGPDGTVAVFNDPTDPNYVGMLNDVTGLDSAPIRESADDLVGADGGWHGSFFYSRRPITMSGQVFGHADAAARAVRLDRMRRATNATRADATLQWQNQAAGSVAMRTFVRRQQPLRITGAWVKDFQILLVSQYAPLFSDALHTQANSNLVLNPSFEIGSPPTNWVAANALGSLTKDVGGLFGPSTARFAPTGVNQGIAGNGMNITLAAGQTYTLTAYVYATGADTFFMQINDGVNAQNSALQAVPANVWTRLTFTFTCAVGSSLYFPIIYNSSSSNVFWVDGVQLLQGSTPQAYADTTTNLVIENQGDYPAAPLVTINGPSTNPVVTNTTTGKVLKFVSGFTIASGSSVVVDVLNHVAVLNGTTSVSGSLDFINSTWPAILTGNNTFTLTGGGTLSLSWRDQWV